MVPPNGPAAARAGSTWIHWWSPVASANASTCACVISCHSVTPSSLPAAACSSSMPVIVVMAANPNRARREPGPLLAVDAPSPPCRAFHGLPKTITTPEGTPVNALLGVSNLLLQAVELHDPRAVVLCFGEEAAPYRVELYAGYHADRPEMPEELVPQWQDAPAYFGAFNWSVAHAPELEADDLLGSLAQIETRAGGRALLYTGDRDMFQCVGEDVAVLWPVGAKGEPEVIGPAEVH